MKILDSDEKQDNFIEDVKGLPPFKFVTKRVYEKNWCGKYFGQTKVLQYLDGKEYKDVPSETEYLYLDKER